MRLTGKTVLITGGAGAIGRATAQLFAKEGAAILVADVDDARGEETAALVREAGGDAIYVHADVASAPDAERMVAAAEMEYGGLHVLFNNAGIMHSLDDDAISTDEDDLGLDDGASTSKACSWAASTAYPRCDASGGGSVINTASFVAKLGAATPQLAYTASKGGVLAMTRELAVIHARENIRVNALCPGPSAH